MAWNVAKVSSTYVTAEIGQLSAQVSDIAQIVSDVLLKTSDVQIWTSDMYQKTSDVLIRTSSTQMVVSDILVQTSDTKQVTSDILLKSSDTVVWTSDTYRTASDVQRVQGVQETRQINITVNTSDIEDQLDIVARHNHSREWWIGKRAVQIGVSDWGTPDSMSDFIAISGTDDWGTDADDEAKVIGTGDSPFESGRLSFDLHRVLFTDLSADVLYKFRLYWVDWESSDVLANAIANSDFTEFMAQNPVSGTKALGTATDIRIPRLTVGAKIYVRTRCSTNNATAKFLVGIHEYDAQQLV